MIRTHLKKIIIATVLLTIAGGGYYYFDNSSEADESAKKAPPKMVDHPTKAAVGSGLIDIEGGIGNISANMNGIITKVFVKEGEWVEVGTILAAQEDEAERISLDESLSNLKNQRAQIELLALQTSTANRELERIKPLYEIGAITSSDFDKANDRVLELSIRKKSSEANLLRNENNVKKARFNLEQRKIKAPMSGTIVEITANPGVGASTMNITNLFTIIPDSPYIVKAKVNGSLYNKLFVNQKAKITTAYDKKKSYDAVVTRISKYFPAQKETNAFRGSSAQMVDVTLSLEDKSLLIGQKVQVQFLKKETQKKETSKQDETANDAVKGAAK